MTNLKTLTMQAVNIILIAVIVILSGLENTGIAIAQKQKTTQTRKTPTR